MPVSSYDNADPVTLRDKLQGLTRVFLQEMQPPERLTLDEWADKYRVLPRETSSEYGRWKTSRFPFLKKIMFALSPQSRAREIVAQKGAQLGFTEVCINKLLYNADQDPGPTMYTQKTGDAAEDFSSQKLDPNISICEKVSNTLGRNKPKQLSNSWNNKGFPGGFLVIGGANSSAFLRSKSIRDALVDEEDSYSGSVGGDGSPIASIRKRQANFHFSKMFRLSTPKFKETSTICPAYEQGSQERYYLPCPHCNPDALINGPRIVIQWEFLKWSNETGDDGEPIEIYLECPHCEGKIYEHYKTWMLETGEWMSEKGSPGSPYIVGDVAYPSFHINSLYSPLGFYSWADAVREWMQYVQTKDKALLQVFINQVLGEAYTTAGQDVSANWLEKRKAEYIPGDPERLPMEALVITAGIDVQPDRLEVDVVAWGLNETSWGVEYKIIYGDTRSLGDARGMDHTGQPTPWAILDDYLHSTWVHENGQQMPIECTLIDSGYIAEVVHVFCRNREHRRIFPVKGRDGWGRGYIERPKRRHEKFHTWPFTAWVDEIKDKIYSMLTINTPGPGYCYYPDKECYSKKYFNGLTAENKKVKISGGKRKLYWECPPGVRNEPLDCRGYALAALKVYSPRLEQRASRMNPLDLADKSQPGIEGYKSPAPAKKRKITKRVASPGL